jgi:hypothetical protein
MLFTDSDVATQSDLIQIDSLVTTAAKTAKPHITLSGPGSICEQAWRECGQKILAAMQMYTSYLMQPGMSGGHVAAVNNTGVPARTQSRTRLNQIVASESQYGGAKSPVQLWMAYHALTLFYREAALRMEKDIYERRYVQYEKDSTFWWRQLRQNGLPFVWQELEAPGAKHSVNAGTWNGNNLTAATAAGAIGGAFAVAITYYDGTRYQSTGALNGNAESAPSDTLSVVTTAGQSIQVSISSLNPPTGAMDNVGLAAGAWTPLNASNWNLWVGQQEGPLYLQQQGIPIGTTTFALPNDPVMSGPTMGAGQYQDLNMIFQNLISRG